MIHFLINCYFLGLKVHGALIKSSFDMNAVKLFEWDDVAVEIVLSWKHVLQAYENEEDIFDSLHTKRKKTLNLDLTEVYFLLFRFAK